MNEKEKEKKKRKKKKHTFPRESTSWTCSKVGLSEEPIQTPQTGLLDVACEREEEGVEDDDDDEEEYEEEYEEEEDFPRTSISWTCSMTGLPEGTYTDITHWTSWR